MLISAPFLNQNLSTLMNSKVNYATLHFGSCSEITQSVDSDTQFVLFCFQHSTQLSHTFIYSPLSFNFCGPCLLLSRFVVLYSHLVARWRHGHIVVGTTVNDCVDNVGYAVEVDNDIIDWKAEFMMRLQMSFTKYAKSVCVMSFQPAEKLIPSWTIVSEDKY